MRGNGKIFHPGDSIVIEIRIGEAILNRVYIQKSTPPVNLKQEGETARVARSGPPSSVSSFMFLVSSCSFRIAEIPRSNLKLGT